MLPLNATVARIFPFQQKVRFVQGCESETRCVQGIKGKCGALKREPGKDWRG